MKYRIWDKKEKMYVQDYDDFFVNPDGEIYIVDLYEGINRFCKPDRYVIEQYTGLKDKNGKEIYKGDIVYFSVFDYNGLDTQYLGIVKFANGKWEIWNNEKDEYYDCDGAFDLYWVKEQDDELEIIGNIHENAELLEEKK